MVWLRLLAGHSSLIQNSTIPIPPLDRSPLHAGSPHPPSLSLTLYPSMLPMLSINPYEWYTIQVKWMGYRHHDSPIPVSSPKPPCLRACGLIIWSKVWGSQTALLEVQYDARCFVTLLLESSNRRELCDLYSTIAINLSSTYDIYSSLYGSLHFLSVCLFPFSIG